MKASRILLTGALVATVTTTSPAHAQEQGRIAYLIGPSDLAANLDLVVRDIESGNTVVLTSDGEIAVEPDNEDVSYSLAWSPDGRRIAFKANGRIDVIDVDDGTRWPLITGESPGSPAWSPDGTRIAFNRFTGSSREIFVMDVAGGEPVNVTNSPGTDAAPAWSPDGRKIAFWSHRDGNSEIYVMNADGSDLTRLTDSPEADIESRLVAGREPHRLRLWATGEADWHEHLGDGCRREQRGQRDERPGPRRVQRLAHVVTGRHADRLQFFAHIRR
jgi:Tol biopolymer transport system component